MTQKIMTPLNKKLAFSGKMTSREQQYIQETFDINRVIPLEPSVDAVERELGAPATA